jgi:LysM repeat protein
LTVYRLGNGPSARAIIGGIHGGYEWNTVELVSQTLAYLQQNPQSVPSGVTLYVIPCANPDGYAAGKDPIVARMNGNQVDLNRNWDYQWQATATHGTRPVSAGASPFSEPETASLRDLILNRRVQAAIFYHSASGKIFSGADMTHSVTLPLAKLMTDATGYRYAPEGVPGQITTGDAIDWLSTQGIAAIEIELTTHQDIEWERNLRGILAFLKWSMPGRGPVATLAPLQGSFITYTVQPGDSLGAISLQFDVSEQDIMRANGLTDANAIVAGQSLRIPVESSGGNP